MGDLVKVIGDLLEWINRLDGPGSLAFLRTVDPIAFSAVTKPTTAWGAMGVSVWLGTSNLTEGARRVVMKSVTDGASFLKLAGAVADIPLPATEQAVLTAAIADAAEWEKCAELAPNVWSPGAMRVFLRLITTQREGGDGGGGGSSGAAEALGESKMAAGASQQLPAPTTADTSAGAAPAASAGGGVNSYESKTQQQQVLPSSSASGSMSTIDMKERGPSEDAPVLADGTTDSNDGQASSSSSAAAAAAEPPSAMDSAAQKELLMVLGGYDGTCWSLLSKVEQLLFVAGIATPDAAAVAAAEKKQKEPKPKWREGPSLPAARRGAVAVPLRPSRRQQQSNEQGGGGGGGGVLLVAGGNDGGAGATSSALLFDQEAQSWREVAPMSTPRLGAAGVALPDGRSVAVIGGDDGMATELATVEVFHLSEQEEKDGGLGTWTTLPPMSTPRKLAAAAALDDGRIVVAGGYYTPPVDPSASAADKREADKRLSVGASQSNILASAEMYVPPGGGGGAGSGGDDHEGGGGGKWVDLPPMAYQRDDCAAAALSGDRVVVLGGRYRKR